MHTLILLITILFSLLLVIGLLLWVKKRIRETDKNSDKFFFELLEKKINLELIKDKTDVEILANSIAREYDTGYSLAPLLENFLKFCIEGKECLLTQEKYEFIKKLIIQENEDKPYSGIPEEERRLLINIRDSIKHSDTESILFNLDELKSILTTRNKVYEKTIFINKWSVPLSIVGVIFTIVFGLISIKQPINIAKTESLIEKSNFNPSEYNIFEQKLEIEKLLKKLNSKTTDKTPMDKGAVEVEEKKPQLEKERHEANKANTADAKKRAVD